MRLAVLCSADSWYFRDVAHAAAGRHDVVAVPFSQLAASVALDANGGGNGVESHGIDLQSYDAVLVRTMPPGSLEQVVFRMDALARLEAAGVPVVNPPKAIETAVDKYLASAKLRAAGLDHPATVVCQTWEDALSAFERLGGDVVVKPLFGSEGRGITRVTDEAVALRVFKALAQIGAVIYLQAFVPHDGYNVRVLVIGERMLAMRRVSADDWRTNVSRGARAERIEMTPQLADLARRACSAVGAPIAGVDILPGRDGRQYVIEVNAVPGWRALARTHGVDVAKIVLEYVAEVAAAK